MTRFLDGPVKGHTLLLQRAPLFLRVVENGQTVDALDQLDDTMRPGDIAYVYIQQGIPSFAFIDGKKIRGKFAISEYKVFESQPPQEILRDNERWVQWVRETYESLPKH